MTTLNFLPSIWHSLVTAFTFPAKSNNTEPVLETSSEDRMAEQDIFIEMVWSNPAGLSGDLDVHHMMDRFCGRG
jgi:hypothetical protein